MKHRLKRTLLLITTVIALVFAAFAVQSFRSDVYVHAQMKSGTEWYVKSTAGAVYFIWIGAPSGPQHYDSYWRVGWFDSVNWEPYGVPCRPWLPAVIRRQVLFKEAATATILVVQYWALLFITSFAPLLAMVRYLSQRRRHVHGFSVKASAAQG
jgi:hypothetical protein